MRPAFPILLLTALLASGCVAPERHLLPTVNEVVATSEQGGKFIALVGPRRQHGDPFLGVRDTNFFLLRSFIDTRNRETAHQLFVEDSYVGKEKLWDTARDGSGQELRVVPISKHEITCEARCSYAEEFAAVLPAPLLRGGNSLTVTFADQAGDRKTIAVPPELVQKQLAAMDGVLAARPAVAAAPSR